MENEVKETFEGEVVDVEETTGSGKLLKVAIGTAAVVGATVVGVCKYFKKKKNKPEETNTEEETEDVTEDDGDVVTEE